MLPGKEHGSQRDKEGDFLRRFQVLFSFNFSAHGFLPFTTPLPTLGGNRERGSLPGSLGYATEKLREIHFYKQFNLQVFNSDLYIFVYILKCLKFYVES